MRLLLGNAWYWVALKYSGSAEGARLSVRANASIEVVAEAVSRHKTGSRRQIGDRLGTAGVHVLETGHRVVLVPRRCRLGAGPAVSPPCRGILAGLLLATACSSETTFRLLPTSDEDGSVDGSVPALSFYGPYDTVRIADSELLDLPQDFSVELWVFVRSFNGGHSLFNRWQLGVGDIQLTFGTPEPLSEEQLPISEPTPSYELAAWGYVAGNTWITVVAADQPSTNQWHHIAVSYGGGAFKLYVDGARVAERASEEVVATPMGAAFIGATARVQLPTASGRWWPPVDGYIADVRLSATDRYPGDFEPEPELSADDATVALWKLDEGVGETALDSGPHELDGSIEGAHWERAPPRR